MADHHKRFARWRRGLAEPTSYLVSLVVDVIVPEFQSRDFVWYADYAGGDSKEIASNTIPLQRRRGEDWPTVQIHFSDRARPWFTVYFAELPERCRRLGGDSVPREQAIVPYAPAYFMLCKGESRNLDGQFGYHWFSLRPRWRIDREVQKASRLIPTLFDLFDDGVLRGWLDRPFGYVHDHVMLMDSWASDTKRQRGPS